MAQSPFLWGAQGKKMSPEEVARQRAVAALLSQEAIDTSPVGHWSQGAARLVNAFSGVRKERQASAAEEQGRSGAKSVIDALLGGGNVSMSSSGTLAPGQAAMYASTPVAEGGLGYSGQAPSAPMAQGGNKQAFIEAMMPHALAVSAQTGLDPRLVIAQSAQETGWGKSAPGNNYFGIKSHGKAGGNTMATNEVINGQTVRINDSFRGYGDMGESALGYASFLKENPRYRDMLSAPDLDSQVAALGRSGYATDPNYAASVGSIARSIPMPDGSVSMSTQGAPSGGGYAAPQPAPQGTSPVMQALLQASTDPWVAQEYGPVLQALMGQEQSRQQFAMEQADPMRQLEMQKAQLEIEQMRNPDAPKPIEVGGVLLDPVTYQPIFDSRQADGAKAPETKTVKMQDGSDVLVQWNPATQVWDAAPIPQGGTGGAAPGKLTESQAKTTLFQNLQTETQPVLLDLEKQFDPANMADKAAANLPIVGNYFTSPEYQLYKSNATAWAEGALRISTGAAATEPEIQRNLETYFAQPGDTPMTVAYKAQMREMYNRSIQRSLGRDPGDEKLPLPSEFAAQFAAQQPPPKMGGALPTPPGLEPPAPAPEPQRQGATPFRSRGLSPAPPESAPIEDISALPTVQSPDEARRLPSGTRFRDPQGNIRMVP